MLQSIHNKTQGPVTWLIVIAIALSFSIFFFGTNLFSVLFGGSSHVAAKVNGRNITWPEVDYRADYFMQSVGQDRNGLSVAEQNSIKLKTLQLITEEYSVIDFVRNAGLIVPEQQVMQELRNIPDFQVDGKFSPEKYMNIINNNGNNLDAFYREFKQGLLKQQLQRGLIATGGFTAPVIQKLDYSVLKQLRDFHYVIIPGDKFADKVELKPEDIKKYYETHQDSYRTKELVKLQYLDLNKADIEKTIKATPQDLKKQYNSNLEQYKELGEFSKITKTLERDFIAEQAEIIFANKLSKLESLVFEDPTRLDLVAKKLNVPLKQTDFIDRQATDFDASVMDFAFNEDAIVNKTNSELLPLGTDHYMVVRILEHKPSVDQSLEAVRSQIIDSMRKEQASKLAQEFANQLQQSVANNLNSDATDKLQLKWIEKISIDRYDRGIQQEILASVFGLHTAQPVQAINLSEPDSNGYDNYAVVKLDAIHTADLQQLSETDLKKFENELSNMYKQNELALMDAQARKSAKVKMYTKNLKNMIES